MSFYFEPQSRYLTASGISSQIGSQVLEWDTTRQLSIGLFTASKPVFKYNRFIEKLDAGVWTKFDTIDDAITALPELGIDSGVFPQYILVRTKVALSGAELTTATNEAEAVVAAEVKTRLSKVDTYLTTAARAGHNLHADMLAYRDALSDIASDVNYPGVLAYQVEQGTLTDWPVEPTNIFDVTDLTLPIDCYTREEIDSKIGTSLGETNADIAFRRIVLSYSVPGSYPEKATAMDNAVATYTVDGDVEDLYNAAVTELTTP